MKTTERLFELISLLDGQRFWKLDELIERFQVSARTLYRDLARLEELDLLLDRDDRGYRIVGKADRVVTLTAQQEVFLQMLLRSPMIEGSERLRFRADELRNRLIKSDPERVLPAVLAGPERTGPGSDPVREEIERAIESRHGVSIRYVSLRSGARWRRVDPWRLLHRDGVWYLAGYCQENRELRFFRLDRVGACRRLPESVTAPDESSIDQALEASWSIYKGDATMRVRIVFSPELAPLIAHARHHPGEVIRELESGELEYQLELSHLDEIARWVIGFGGGARVVAPRALRERVVELASGVLVAHPQRRGPKRAERERNRDIAIAADRHS